MSAPHVTPAPGRLVLAGVPIGNVKDATVRLREALSGATVVAAEDTRRLRRLAADLDVDLTAKLLSCFEGNEVARIPELLELLRAGQDVVLVTDAGMPAVSDPGFRIVAAVVAAGLPVGCVPGPSSVTTALALSGLPSDRFCFEGFLPRKAGERRKRLAQLAEEPRTMVVLEAPHRLAAALDDLATAFGASRAAVLCRELTKTYEEVVRGTLADLVQWATGDIRGEVTLVVAGAPERPAEAVAADELARLVAAHEEAGADRKSAMAEVALRTGLPKREVFDAVVAHKHEAGNPRDPGRATH